MVPGALAQKLWEEGLHEGEEVFVRGTVHDRGPFRGGLCSLSGESRVLAEEVKLQSLERR